MILEHTTSGSFHINTINPQSYQMYEDMDDLIPSSATSGLPDVHGQALMYHLSALREKVQQVQSLVGAVVSPDPIQQEALPVALAGAGDLVQDIIVAASSMLYTFQQVAQLVAVPARHDEVLPQHGDRHMKAAKFEGPSEATNEVVERFLDAEAFYSKSNCGAVVSGNNNYEHGNKAENRDKPCSPSSSSACDIIEIDAADLLAKYTHYCQICGKGFKRDANLRMHMRAHGDEYKTNAALANPTKRGGRDAGTATAADEDAVPSTTTTTTTTTGGAPARKYSCPQEGCRWNRKHAKFQPLKSMICVKNHYKRSHCPKMYVCNRCNRKQFSVLSDLRTHEKHCGDLKWMCSCGTTFSRKDKLMGHVALFTGHSPVINCFSKLP